VGPQALRSKGAGQSSDSPQLAVGAWAVYKLCEDEDLPHVRINNSIRVRPTDLAEFIADEGQVRARRQTALSSPGRVGDSEA
jgi:hypothetical protein